MRYLAREKYALSRARAELLFAECHQQFAVHNVNPLVLIAVHPARPGAGSGELKNTQSAARIPAGDLAMQGLAAELHVFVEARVAGSDPKTGKHFVVAHLLCPPYVVD